MNYFTSYHWGKQFLYFLLLVFTFWGAGGFVVYMLLPRFTPWNLEQIQDITENSPYGLISATVWVQGILSLVSFAVPALLFGYLAHPQPAQYLGLRRPARPQQLLWVVLLMLGAMPVLQALEGLISLINFGPKIKAAQEQNDHLMKAFLTMPDFGAFLKTFLVMALVPAFGEELFFRGVMLRLFRRPMHNMVLPIVFTSLFFAFAHSNVYGFLSIFGAGVLLAVIYNLTGSLWCNMVGHLFFNGLQVVLAYGYASNAAVKAYLESDTVPFYQVVAGAVLFAFALYRLIKDKTPLPDHWADESTPKGPQGQEWDFMNQNNLPDR